MNINDRLYAVYLIDYYGPLLTEHQLAILNEYYDNDLSMQEIAENHQISKSAVADIIKRSFNQLQTYENKLHLLTKARKREIIIEELLSKDDQEIKALAGKLKELELGE